jgi:hypothetical protein
MKMIVDLEWDIPLRNLNHLSLIRPICKVHKKVREED